MFTFISKFTHVIISILHCLLCKVKIHFYQLGSGDGNGGNNLPWVKLYSDSSIG